MEKSNPTRQLCLVFCLVGPREDAWSEEDRQKIELQNASWLDFQPRKGRHDHWPSVIGDYRAKYRHSQCAPDHELCLAHLGLGSVQRNIGRRIEHRSTNEYYSTGELKKNTGSRVYPVEYKVDAQGRMTNMTTWQDYPNSGSAVTTWKYDRERGFLTNKLYAGDTTTPTACELATDPTAREKSNSKDSGLNRIES